MRDSLVSRASVWSEQVANGIAGWIGRWVALGWAGSVRGVGPEDEREREREREIKGMAKKTYCSFRKEVMESGAVRENYVLPARTPSLTS
jgi:hypothetical protein